MTDEDKLGAIMASPEAWAAFVVSGGFGTTGRWYDMAAEDPLIELNDREAQAGEAQ